MNTTSQVNPKLQDILTKMGCPEDFDPSKHNMVLHTRFRERFINPPDWLSFSAFIDQNAVIVLAKPSLSLI